MPPTYISFIHSHFIQVSEGVPCDVNDSAVNLETAALSIHMFHLTCGDKAVASGRYIGKSDEQKSTLVSGTYVLYLNPAQGPVCETTSMGINYWQDFGWGKKRKSKRSEGTTQTALDLPRWKFFSFLLSFSFSPFPSSSAHA